MKKSSARWHHGDLRAALLDRAWKVVAKKGLEALSLRAVAQALGVSNAAPAHHFENREALIRALRDEAWLRFAVELEAHEAGGLTAVGRAYVEFARAHPRQMELMFRHEKHPAAASGRAWDVLVRAVASALPPARRKDAAEVQALAVAAWSMAHGYAAIANDGLVPTGDAVRDRVLDVVRAGLASKPR